MRRSIVLLLALALSACASAVRRSMPPTARDWLTTLSTAKAAARDGHFDDADRTLYDYQLRHAGTAEAHEAVYWRALFKLDPANRGGSTRTASEQLDSYLADTTTSTLHRTEARLLLHLAASIDSIGRSRLAAANSSDDARAEEEEKAQAREEELQKQIKTLKDQLDKTTAELERIKKRLTDRTP